jgi:hypothetical protein
MRVTLHERASNVPALLTLGCRIHRNPPYRRTEAFSSEKRRIFGESGQRRSSSTIRYCGEVEYHFNDIYAKKRTRRLARIVGVIFLTRDGNISLSDERPSNIKVEGRTRKRDGEPVAIRIIIINDAQFAVHVSPRCSNELPRRVSFRKARAKKARLRLFRRQNQLHLSLCAACKRSRKQSATSRRIHRTSVPVF